jgi:DNA-binding protein YbaB
MYNEKLIEAEIVKESKGGIITIVISGSEKL